MIKKNFSISLDEKLMAYLTKKRKAVLTLTVVKSGGGCCPTFEIANVDVNQPSSLENYTHFEHQGISIYISNNTRIIASTLSFKLNKTLFIKDITVSGISLISRE